MSMGSVFRQWPTAETTADRVKRMLEVYTQDREVRTLAERVTSGNPNAIAPLNDDDRQKLGAIFMAMRQYPTEVLPVVREYMPELFIAEGEA